MNGLDLFSGIGGISIALQEWVRTVAYCEIEPYCQAILLQRMLDGDIDNAPIWDDITTLSTSSLPAVDIISGGFPCQDISCAGSGKGLEGSRSGLFYEMLRLAEEIKPKFIFIENVPAITTRGGIEVVREIASVGYDCRWCTISASSVGALHKRERWFLLACHSDSKSSWQASEKAKPNTTIKEAWRRPARQPWPFISRADWQENLSEMDVCTDGVPSYVDRLRALGNSVVPQQAKAAFKLLIFGNYRET